MTYRIPLLNILGNSVGAFLSFLYFSYIVQLNGIGGAGSRLYQNLSFIIGTVVLISLFFAFTRRWARPLFQIRAGQKAIHDLEGFSGQRIRRKAIQFAPMVAAATLLAWFMAGFFFGILTHAIGDIFFGIPSPSLVECLRMFFGITVVGGSMTTLIVYFSVEHVWRKEIPLFFPEGNLSSVQGAFKVGVKTRLLVVFLMISLIPLFMIGMGVHAKTKAIISAETSMQPVIFRSMIWQIVYIICIGGASALILSVFVAKSVSDPLKKIEEAMKKVGTGDLDVRAEIVSNDEFGAVAEGFNEMVKGLRESEIVKDSFGKYISQEIRDEILAGRISLDGEMKRATLLFSDLRDFTPFVESRHPKQVVEVMNQYFSEMTEAIKQNRGLVLQYVGDEIEAVFGAPVLYEDHPDMALRAAMEMRRRLVRLNQRLDSQGVRPLRHGIGIHTGAVLAGNIGSKDRISYALVGDTVNLASRISNLTKEFASDILVSQTTHDLLAETYRMEQLAAVKVKGKEREVMIYRLLDED